MSSCGLEISSGFVAGAAGCAGLGVGCFEGVGETPGATLSGAGVPDMLSIGLWEEGGQRRLKARTAFSLVHFTSFSGLARNDSYAWVSSTLGTYLEPRC